MSEWMTDEDVKKRINGMLFEILPGHVTLEQMEMTAQGMMSTYQSTKLYVENQKHRSSASGKVEII